jgi:hypothetical protein
MEYMASGYKCVDKWKAVLGGCGVLENGQSEAALRTVKLPFLDLFN